MATGKNKQQSEHKIQSGHQRTVTQLLPPHRLYYSFADALKIVRSKVPNCTADYLLYCGLMGRVKFFIHVPYSFSVYTVCELGADWNHLTDPPRLLILDKLDCGAIEWNKKTTQTSFLRGYWFDGICFREIYPKLDQLWPTQEIKWCIFENVTYDSLKKNHSDSRSESKAQTEKGYKAIIAPNSRNGNVNCVHISNASDQSTASDIQNSQITQFVRDVGLEISEKSLFVMLDEVNRLIQHEVTSLELAAAITSMELQEESLYQKTLKAGQSPHLQFQINRRSMSYLSPNIYFTLEEAVEAVKPQHPECTARLLLEFGVSGKLTFITPVPIAVDLKVVNRFSSQPDCSHPVSNLKPLFLIVESAECGTILREGKGSLGRFKRGHGYDFGSPFDMFIAKNPDGSHCDFHQWATLHEDKPHKIEITVDRLFLVQSDLANLVLNEPGPWKIDGDGRPDVHESFLDHPAESPGTNELQSPKKIDEAIADNPATLTEREVCNRVGRKRSTINAYQNEKSKQYKPDFPKKRPVSSSARSIEYLESEVTDWVNKRRHPK